MRINNKNRSSPSPTFRFTIYDVGQADSILIRVPTSEGVKNILIDAGTSDGYPASNIVNYLNGLGITEIEYMIITHPHLDHIGAADEVITDFTIRNIIIPECEASSKSWLNVLTAMDEKNLAYIPSEAGKTYTIGEASFTILGPIDATSVKPSDANNYSVVIRLSWGDTSFLFTGDAETSSEAEMLNRFPASSFRCNVLEGRPSRLYDIHKRRFSRRRESRPCRDFLRRGKLLRASA